MGTTGIPTLDLSRVQATLGRDENERLTIILTDGTTEVVLAGGDDRADNLSAACRIAGAVWDYQQQSAAQHLAEEPIAVVVSEARAAAYDPASEERITELRGPSPSVSGAY